MPEKVCQVCREPIKEEDQWFRVRQEYVHPFLRCKVFETDFREAERAPHAKEGGCA